MKILKWVTLVLMTFVLNASMAQQNDSLRTKAKATPEQKADKITARLKQELSLSDDQVGKVKAIILEQVKLKQQGEEKRKAMHNELQKALTGILTQEQLAKYKQMQVDRKDKMKSFRHNNNPKPDESLPQPMDQK